MDLIQQKQMGDFLRHSNENNAYEERDRHWYCAELGLADGPICSFSGERGASDEKIADELKMLRKVYSDCEYNEDFWGTQNEAQLKYDAKIKEFAKTPESELYVVFYEDCQSFDTPFMVTCDPRDPWEIDSEWDVFSNWRDNEPSFLEVWNRRKVPYTEAVERIKKMEPLPLKEKLPFKANPEYKQQIDALLPRLVSVENEDTAPYKLVVDQHKIRYDLKQLYIILAAEKFRELLGGYPPPYVGIKDENTLFMQFSQYDSWDFLSKYCVKKDKQYLWDVSNDPDFIGSNQKVFPISIEQYNSHESGW